MKNPNKKVKELIGSVDHVASSHAYIILEGKKSEDLFVVAKNLNGALHGDKVEVIQLPSKTRKGQPTGQVVKILDRKIKTIVGRIAQEGDRVLCLPTGKRLHPVLIPQAYLHDAKERDKVEIKLIDWSAKEAKHIGEVVRVLGVSGECVTERDSILTQFDLDASFDDEIEKAVAQFPDELSAEEKAKRRDFTKVATFTIDPVNAKDFDDALSVQKLPNGDYEVGIHIADVTHYIKEGTPLDEEAFRRGTSVYLVGQVIPMLPERLSNNLCSLKPKEERPALSVVVTFGEHAQIKNVWMGESVIFSDRRFTYDQAHEVITNKKGDFFVDLEVLDGIAKTLRKRRIKDGAITFESTDMEIELNEKQEPIAIKPKASHTTHQLIEEFMLLANRLVAERITKGFKKASSNPGCLYRIHGNPSPEKISIFASFVKHLGYKFDSNMDKVAASLNATLEKSKETPHAHVIQTLAIRSMEQAYYATKETGHFGLGFSLYTHFTSPIRRYIDYVVHLLLKSLVKQSKVTEKSLEKVASHCSSQERKAVEAERASKNFYQVFFLQQHEGKTFEGLISGVTEWGLYVEILENKCEGMVRLSSLTDDFYIFNKERMKVWGKRTKRSYQLGDRVKIKVKQCNIFQQTVDLTLVH